MNFSYDSIKLKSKAQNEDFCFDVETPQGHFFVVLDFAPHDYANLNATLVGKLETVVGSFTSLTRFSADLFLGFLAKEINNFLHHLGEQSSGPEILCSAALCLVGGNRFSYLLRGDVRIDITGGRLLSLSGSKPPEMDAPTDESAASGLEIAKIEGLEQLGAERVETALTDEVQTFTLQDDDVVLVMTQGLEAGFDRRQLPRELVSVGSPEPKLICEALMRASASSRDDRTVVVIAGPYERDGDPALSDLSKAVAVLEAKLNALVESDARRHPAASASGLEVSANAERGQNVAQQIEVLKADLKGKAAGIDLLELDEKLKNLGIVLESKADTAMVLGLERDVLKLGIAANATVSDTAEVSETKETSAVSAAAVPESLDKPAGVERFPMAKVLLLVLVTAIGAAFLGALLHSRVFKKSPEVWSVKTAANQIVISRMDGNVQDGQRTVSLNISEPLKSTGEQTFSSFADVKQYIDTVTSSAATSTPNQSNGTDQSTGNTPAESVTEITVKPGDSLKKFTQIYNVTPEKLRELNPTIIRWTSIRSGQRIRVPSSAPANPTASPTPDQAAAQPAPNTSVGTIEVTVGPGDSLNRFAQQYNSTPARLRELNPQITNWGSIRTGQKLLVPAPPGG